MNIKILLMVFLVALITIPVCVTRVKVRDRADNIDTIVFVLASGFGLFAIVVWFLFAVFSKPVTLETQDYRLESFQEFDNGYGYSYYDEAGKFIGGFVEKDAAKLDFCDEEPSVSTNASKIREQFWIFYLDREVNGANYIFNVVCRDGIKIS